MLLISAQHLIKRFSTEPVLNGACLEMRSGQHVGLVGPNGAGKTTLLQILMQELEPESGSISKPPGVSMGFLRQRQSYDTEQTVWEAAKTGLQPLINLTAEAHRVAGLMAAATGATRVELARKYDRLHTELENRGGYQIDFKIRRVLEGLGFTRQQDDQPVGQLSGGQQNRLMLAKLLIEEPDLMLLDEPSNHLDIEVTQWLEDFLAKSKQAFLLVSHDRYFLDRVTTRTLELVNGTVESYAGNYSKYKRLKQERLAVEQRTFQKQQQEVEKLKEFIRRHHYGQKHAQAEDRRKKLERIEVVEPPREIPVPPMKFHDVNRCGDIVLRVEGLAKSFEHTLFSNVSFQIQRGQRWGILGPNGSGKTTLLRCLLGDVQPQQGTITIGAGVEIGYFDQHLQCISSQVTSAEAIRPTDESDAQRRLDDGQRRDLLARFGIIGDAGLQPVNSLSGGQRTRVALANLAAQRANFLLLDEPTNHLDLWAREALETALLQFQGTVLLVSHDRFFLNRVCDHLLVLGGDRVRVIDGNYDTFRMLDDRQSLADNGNARPVADDGPPVTAAPRRRRRFPYRKVTDIEQDIANCEVAIDRLHQDLADPNVLRDRQLVLQAKQQLAEETRRLEQLLEHWEEASELN